MSKLILIRHGQSAWNAANKFTGWVDVPLSKLGVEEAEKAAQKLKSYPIDVCFTSMLIRAIQTALICLGELDSVLVQGKCPVIHHDADDPNWHGWDQHTGEPDEEIPVFTCSALDERFYGDLQGLNKAKTAEKYGDEQVKLWRRSYSVRPPGGESLEDTAARTVPYFQSRIMTHAKAGENVLVSAHGNSLRSIILHLETISKEEIPQLELATGVPIIYEINSEGGIVGKEVIGDRW
ncbi:2,3-bisphosphoglycerate-dependent phosphoglycerate mutase [Kovacikia minuta CCNUW1]|uniref:2,3-bisphosphoglycerate-dependent phosphoglycerate mutase n=1 Tax=Kovacikia minuta TaxID=2931930 RepID=UPI001CCFDBD5|nr:2,3-bisphosphoglycerate-dependent phosphoglycerate mutase [Kovacikia minuta]UBF24209.1 2,3-bisphosphoglycerate-dependent phosphoglycerate mutase [Kovacikia minuta CCNUW1]